MSKILDKFTPKYEHSINKGLSFHTLKYVRDNFDFDFDVFLKSKNKNLQRELCWTNLQKHSLIYTILRDRRINPIVVVQYKTPENETKNYFFKVIDGKQRLNTAFDYIDNKFSIPIDGLDYYFKDLPEDCQRRILGYNFIWDVHYSYWDKEISDDTMIQIFEECNFLGTPQDTLHLHYLKQ